MHILKKITLISLTALFIAQPAESFFSFSSLRAHGARLLSSITSHMPQCSRATKITVAISGICFFSYYLLLKLSNDPQDPATNENDGPPMPPRQPIPDYQGHPLYKAGIVRVNRSEKFPDHHFVRLKTVANNGIQQFNKNRVLKDEDDQPTQYSISSYHVTPKQENPWSRPSYPNALLFICPTPKLPDSNPQSTFILERQLILADSLASTYNKPVILINFQYDPSLNFDDPTLQKHTAQWLHLYIETNYEINRISEIWTLAHGDSCGIINALAQSLGSVKNIDVALHIGDTSRAQQYSPAETLYNFHAPSVTADAQTRYVSNTVSRRIHNIEVHRENDYSHTPTLLNYLLRSEHLISMIMETDKKYPRVRNLIAHCYSMEDPIVYRHRFPLVWPSQMPEDEIQEEAYLQYIQSRHDLQNYYEQLDHRPDPRAIAEDRAHQDQVLRHRQPAGT